MTERIDRAAGTGTPPFWERSAFAFGLIFIATLVLQLPIFDRWYAYMDEGHILMFADIVARGGDIYRDATIYPLPGAFYFLAYMFKLFGPSVILSRWIIVLAFSAFVPLVFLWLRGIVPLRYAWAGVGLLWLYRIWAFPHWQMYSYSTTSLLLVLCSMIAMLRFFRTRKLGVLMLAGFFFGIAVAFKQDYGAALLLAALPALVIFHRSGSPEEEHSLFATLAAFMLPGALVGAVLGLYFLHQGLLGDLIQMTVLNHMRGLATFEYPEIPDFFPFFAQDPFLRDVEGVFSYIPGIIFTVDMEAVRTSALYRETPIIDMLIKIFFYAPYWLIAIGGARLWLIRSRLGVPDQRDATLRELLLYLFACGILLVLTFNKPQDYVHFAVVYWPFLCLGLIYVSAALDGRRALALTFAIVMLIPAGVTLAYSLRLVDRLRELNTDLVPGERAGIHASPAEARLLEGIVEYVHENSEPDDIVSVMPYFPFAQFLMNRMGPHRSSYIVWPFAEFEDRDARIVSAMEEKDVDLIIYNFTQFVSFPWMSEFAPELFGHVVENYRMDRVFSYDHSGYKMAGLKRVEGPTPGRPLIDSVTEEGFLRVEPEFGPPIALPPGLRRDYLLEELWPFRPVVSILPTDRGGRTVYAYTANVPAAARLQTAVGAHPRAWFKHPSYSTTYTLELVAEKGERTELYSRTLKPHTSFDDRGWFEVDVDLSDYAGQEVTFEFATSTQLPEGETIWGGGWERPRLVTATRAGPG